jgi:carbonic anhydrase/acetyltransferase-like protein (isoleucine patch superfamily)
MPGTNPPPSPFTLKKYLFPIALLIIFSVSLLPPVLLGLLAFRYINLTVWWHILLLPAVFYIGIIITIQCITIIPAAFVSAFNIKYKPGTYTYDYKTKESLKWIIVCSLYTPGRKIFEIIPLARTRTAYYRLLGMTIGKNTLIGGVIKDPCLTSFGSNTTMGEYAIIYGHIQNMQHDTIEMARVTIGDNCVIGAGAIIMPGVTIPDNTIVAAGALVPKNQTLLSGRLYAGVPAREIQKKPTPTQ